MRVNNDSACRYGKCLKFCVVKNGQDGRKNTEKNMLTALKLIAQLSSVYNILKGQSFLL